MVLAHGKMNETSWTIIDTNIIIDFLRGIDEAAEYLDSISEERRAISPITLLELGQGIRTKPEKERIIRFLKAYRIKVLAMTNSTYILSDNLFDQYEKRGLDLVDSMIASSCIENKSRLVTRNIRHFEFINGLFVEKPLYSSER